MGHPATSVTAIAFIPGRPREFLKLKEGWFEVEPGILTMAVAGGTAGRDATPAPADTDQWLTALRAVRFFPVLLPASIDVRLGPKFDRGRRRKRFEWALMGTRVVLVDRFSKPAKYKGELWDFPVGDQRVCCRRMLALGFTAQHFGVLVLIEAMILLALGARVFECAGGHRYVSIRYSHRRWCPQCKEVVDKLKVYKHRAQRRGDQEALKRLQRLLEEPHQFLKTDLTVTPEELGWYLRNPPPEGLSRCVADILEIGAMLNEEREAAG